MDGSAYFLFVNGHPRKKEIWSNFHLGAARLLFGFSVYLKRDMNKTNRQFKNSRRISNAFLFFHYSYPTNLQKVFFQLYLYFDFFYMIDFQEINKSNGRF